MLFCLLLVLVACQGRCDGSMPTWVRKGRIVDGLTINVEDPLNYLGTRNFSIFLPSGYTGRSALPLVWDFHGYYDSADSEAREDLLSRTAERNQFAVVYPNAFSDDPVDPFDWENAWNGDGSMGQHGKYGPICNPQHGKYPCYKSCRKAGVCTHKHPSAPHDCHCSSCVDDIGYIKQLWRHLDKQLCINSGRVHGTGISMGAIFLYYLTTVELGFTFASIVPVAGSFYFGHLKAPKSPVPVLSIHGRIDHTIPMNASTSYGKFRDNCPVPAVGREDCAVSSDYWYYHTKEQILTLFGEHNGCSANLRPRTTTHEFDGYSGFYCMEYEGCDLDTIQCTWRGGHTWPFRPGWRRLSWNNHGRKFGQLVWWFMSQFGTD